MAVVRLGMADGSVTRLSLEAYVAGTVVGEQAVTSLPPDVAPSVLQLQALLARTFGVANLGRHGREGFDLCATTHCQVFRRRLENARAQALVDAAVAATAGRILTYRGRPIQAVFHASCGGHTSAGEAVWGGRDAPYLAARPDPYCALDPAAAWSWRVERADLARALNLQPGTRVGNRLDGLTVLSTDEAGRSQLVALVGATSPVVRGEEFRSAVLGAFGARSLQSLRFTVGRVGSVYVFDGRGKGHGAGLCQAGALARLRAGDTVAAVVAYYYPGVVVGRLGS